MALVLDTREDLPVAGPLEQSTRVVPVKKLACRQTRELDYSSLC